MPCRRLFQWRSPLRRPRRRRVHRGRRLRLQCRARRPESSRSSLAAAACALIATWMLRRCTRPTSALPHQECYRRTDRQEGAAIPNRIGVADGRTDQHGYAARDRGSGDRPLSISRVGRQGAHSRRTLRGDRLAQQACGSGACHQGINFAGGPATVKADLWRHDQGCAGGAVGGLGSDLRQTAEGNGSDVAAIAGEAWRAEAGLG
jgi:hypothetical protein